MPPQTCRRSPELRAGTASSGAEIVPNQPPGSPASRENRIHPSRAQLPGTTQGPALGELFCLSVLGTLNIQAPSLGLASSSEQQGEGLTSCGPLPLKLHFWRGG